MIITSAQRQIILDAIQELEVEILDAINEDIQIDYQIKDIGLDDIARLHLGIRHTILTAKLQSAEVALEKLRSFIAPIRSLPPELLAQIFILAASEEEEAARSRLRQTFRLDYHWTGFNENHIALNALTIQERVAHVCQHWRDVSYDIPHLWQRIIVAISEDHDKPINRRSPKMQRMISWLVRTKQVPLDITIWGARTPFMKFWTPISSEAERIRTLRIHHQPLELIQLALRQLPPMPLLESLDLCGVPPKWMSMNMTNILPHGAPRLQEIQTEQIGLSWPQLPLKNITKLVIINRKSKVFVPYAGLMDLLERLADKLQWFAYQDHYHKVRAAEDVLIVRKLKFPVLEKFELNVSDSSLAAQWFTYFDFPALKHVYLDVETEVGSEFNILLRAAVSGKKDVKTGEKPWACFQTCRELTMGPSGNARFGISQFVTRAFPALRKFSSHVHDELFPITEIFEGFGTNCRHLTELHVFQATPVSLLKLINTRASKSSFAKLSKVSLIANDGWSSEEINYVKEQLDFDIEELYQTDETMMDGDQMDYDSEDAEALHVKNYTPSPRVRGSLMGRDLWASGDV